MPERGVQETTVRPATLADSDAIIRLAAHLGYPLDAPVAGPLLESLLARPDHLLLVAEAEEVVGFFNLNLRSQLHHGGAVGTIDELVVDEARRGRGIGA